MSGYPLEGKRVYVCCGGCVGAVKKDPEKYLKKLEERGVTPQPAPKSEQEDDEEAPAHKAGHHH